MSFEYQPVSFTSGLCIIHVYVVVPAIKHVSPVRQKSGAVPAAELSLQAVQHFCVLQSTP